MWEIRTKVQFVQFEENNISSYKCFSFKGGINMISRIIGGVTAMAIGFMLYGPVKEIAQEDKYLLKVIRD